MVVTRVQRGIVKERGSVAECARSHFEDVISASTRTVQLLLAVAIGLLTIMRLCGTIPIAFLVPLFPWAACASHPQASWSTTSLTLVDALSADPDYTSLLRLLQKALLIPTLNRLNGSTFFAPTNEAIKRHVSSNPLWHAVLQDDTFVISDNVQEQLRQQLFYHILNYSLPSLPTEPNIQVHKTLHFPRQPVAPPSRHPPPFPPWMPIPGGTLGGEPQRLRVSTRARVGEDSKGEGGAEIVKGLVDAGNGVILGIADVLEPPLDLGQRACLRSATRANRSLPPQPEW